MFGTPPGLRTLQGGISGASSVVTSSVVDVTSLAGCTIAATSSVGRRIAATRVGRAIQKPSWIGHPIDTEPSKSPTIAGAQTHVGFRRSVVSSYSVLRTTSQSTKITKSWATMIMWQIPTEIDALSTQCRLEQGIHWSSSAM